jgi:hypothetical protein
MQAGAPLESLLRLRIDLATARLLVWVAGTGREAELTPEAHLHFFDRYLRLVSSRPSG